MDRPLYPFTAVVGQERAKQALLCLAVEPRIGGVLLCGEKGTAKSTLVRALGGLEGVRLLELPVSATEDMLLGGVELEAAVRTGCRTFQPGLLARADGAVLYADEVNLLPSALTAALLDTLHNRLGEERARSFHAHFSKIEYSAGGEKVHLTFADTVFGPQPEPLMELLAERGLSPVVICESAGTQAADARMLKTLYEAAAGPA